MHNIVPPPYFARIMASEDRIDRWQSAIYMPPGIHMTEAGVHKVGTDRSKAYVGRVLHLLTPQTKTSSHYFWAMNRNYRLEDAELTEFIRVAVQHTLDEDQNVLELQMRAVLKERPTHFPPLAIRADSAPMRARRLLRKLVKGEIENNTAGAAPTPLAHDPPGALSPKHRISQ
jgi:vanillate O-demethylase monooxygenase subunit